MSSGQLLNQYFSNPADSPSQTASLYYSPAEITDSVFFLSAWFYIFSFVTVRRKLHLHLFHHQAEIEYSVQYWSAGLHCIILHYLHIYYWLEIGIQSFDYPADCAKSAIIQSGGNEEFSLLTVRRIVHTQALYSPAEMKNSVFWLSGGLCTLRHYTVRRNEEIQSKHSPAEQVFSKNTDCYNVTVCKQNNIICLRRKHTKRKVVEALNSLEMRDIWFVILRSRLFNFLTLSISRTKLNVPRE